MSAELDLDDCAAQSAKAVDELAELRGEIARLHSLLAKLDDQPMPTGEPAESVYLGRQQVADEIRAALAATEDDDACLVRHRPRVQRVA
jgi:hypothetical protein